jgi:hypothetical protein
MTAFPAEILPRTKPHLSLLSRDSSSPVEDPGYCTYELLQPLAEALAGAVRFRDACRELQEKAKRRDPQAGVPELFSFDKHWQTKLDVFRPRASSYLTSMGMTVSRQSPRDAQAWKDLDALIEQAMPALLGSVEARRVARVMRGLTAAAASLAADHQGANELNRLLNVADDMAFTVRHPASGREWRVFASGIENNYQLQVLLVDGLMRNSGAERFDPRVVAAYRGLPITDETLTARAQFGMYSIGALRADGTLPRGLAGSDHWIWGERSPRAIQARKGERVIYLGDPPYAMEWDVERCFPTLRSEVEVVEEEVMATLAA